MCMHTLFWDFVMMGKGNFFIASLYCTLFQCCVIFNSTDETELDGRLLVIARVPQVCMLNGSKVRFSFSLLTFILKQVYQKERQNAEMHYIMKYFPDWIRAKKSGTERDFTSNHIQYERLSEGIVHRKILLSKNTYQNISYHRARIFQRV